MATNEKGILGGFSGKVGTVIGGNWNGVDYMRGKPGLIANPRTEKQQYQRAKVGAIVSFLRPMTEFLRVGYKKQAIRMSAFNAATSYNLAHAVNGIYPDIEIDYSKVMVSQGKLPGAQNPQVNFNGNGQVIFTWEDNSTEKEAKPDDIAMLLVVNPETRRVFSVMEGSTRSSKGQEITLPDRFEGLNVHCYVTFRNGAQTLISDSRYAGELLR